MSSQLSSRRSITEVNIHFKQLLSISLFSTAVVANLMLLMRLLIAVMIHISTTHTRTSDTRWTLQATPRTE